MDDFSKYERMRDKGADPKQVYLAGKKDGLDSIALLRLLRSLFSLSLVEAKEVTIIADNLAPSLSEYQERFIPMAKRIVEIMDKRAADDTAVETEKSTPVAD